MRGANIFGWGYQTTQHSKTIEMLGTARNIFDLSWISANVANEDAACPNKVVKRANISANIIIDRLTGALFSNSENRDLSILITLHENTDTGPFWWVLFTGTGGSLAKEMKVLSIHANYLIVELVLVAR